MGDPGVDQASAASPETLLRLAHGAMRGPTGLALVGAHGRIEWVNPAFTDLTGRTPAEAVDRDPFDLLLRPLVAPAELDRLRADLAAGQYICAEVRATARSGTDYWMSFRMGPGGDTGLPEYYVVVVEDVTDRLRVAEEARRAARHAQALADELRAERELLAGVLSTIPHVVFWKDTDHRYLGCNDAYARLRGLPGEASLAGRSEAELPANPLGALIAEIEGEVLQSGRPVVDHSITIAGDDDAARIYALSVLPRYTDGSVPQGVIGIGADVSRITALERQLAQATRLESVGQLAAGLAHEINTPIQYVSDNVLFLTDSFTDVLDALRSIANVARGAEQDFRADGPAPTVDEVRSRLRLLVDGLDLDFLATEIPGALEQTLEGVGRVAEIVRAMKDFSHPGQGRVETDINRSVETTVQVSRNEWKFVAEMELDLDPDVGFVPCFEGELKQVILNLLVNAAHAVADQRQRTGDPELGRIRIATRRRDDTVRISITDSGTGMDEATKQRIFDPFFTTKEVGKGTGQGLAMAHACVVTKHQGSIEVITAPGAGTTFHLDLPTDVELTEPARTNESGRW